MVGSECSNILAAGNSPRVTLHSPGLIACMEISYYMGFYGGDRFVRKFGKYLLLDVSHLKWTEHWFRHKGEVTIFISRFIPVVRHLISISAGIGKMHLTKFIVYTFIGALIWNGFLAYLGVVLGEKWEVIHSYTSELDLIVIGLIVVSLIYFIHRQLKK